jgi:hypothetical protein
MAELGNAENLNDKEIERMARELAEANETQAIEVAIAISANAQLKTYDPQAGVVI